MRQASATDPATGSATGPATGPTGDQRAWSAAAAAVLRKAGRLAADAPDVAAWDELARRTVEGVPVPPLGTPARTAGLATRTAIAVDPGVPPYLRGSAAPDGAGWDVRALIADPDPSSAHRSALADLEGGVTSLWIRIGDGGTAPDDLAAVLDGVHLDMAPVVLQASDAAACASAARALADIARSGSAAPHPDGNLGADPVGRLAGPLLTAPGEADTSRAFDDLPDLLAIAGDLRVRALVVDGTVAHDAGAGDAGEIGYTLAVGAAYLRALAEAGQDVDTACGLLEFRYAATDDQFGTIAKLRAARLTWHRVAELSGAGMPARAQRQHAVTSAAMLTRYDPWVNLLRTTVAVFGAGAGGAAAVTALPYDSALGVPEEFGRRMARNISALLLGESHVGAVADPAGGAHAVEMLTAEIAEAAWAEFGRIEEVGGILAALGDGSLAGRVARIRTERDRRIATRRQPVTGVSEFPNPAEGPATLPRRRSANGAAHRSAAHRWAEPFEALRESPCDDPVLLVTIGSPAAASARVLFARNLLAAGGIPVMEPDPAAGPAGALAGSRGRTVLLAGSDADYADAAGGLQATAAAARDAGAAAVFVTGRPAQALNGLPDGLIDAAVAAGDDVLAFLRTVRESLGGGTR